MEIQQKTTCSNLASAKPDSSDMSKSELNRLDFDDQVEKVTGAIELVDSNLMDNTSLQEHDFADNLEERLQVSRSRSLGRVARVKPYPSLWGRALPP